MSDLDSSKETRTLPTRADATKLPAMPECSRNVPFAFSVAVAFIDLHRLSLADRARHEVAVAAKVWRGDEPPGESR